jgi:hypothetical protein
MNDPRLATQTPWRHAWPRRLTSPLDGRRRRVVLATLERELAWIHATKNWPTRTALRSALFDYIEGFYTPERIQHRLGHQSQPTTSKTQPHSNPCPHKRGNPKPQQGLQIGDLLAARTHSSW